MIGRRGRNASEREEALQSHIVANQDATLSPRATARVYGTLAEELGKKRRGREHEARATAMYLCRTLGGHKLTDIGKVLGLEKCSSVGSACLSMKGRIEREKRLAGRARNVGRRLKTQQRI